MRSIIFILFIYVLYWRKPYERVYQQCVLASEAFVK